MNRLLTIATTILAALALTGCARAPQGGPGAARRLVIEMRVAGVINPNCFYFVAIDNDSDPNDGPLAVVFAGVNGWGTGSITHYVEFHSTLLQGGYGFFRLPDVDVNINDYLGPPTSFLIPGPSGNTLTFTIDMEDLVLPPQTTANDIQELEINFIATDKLIFDPGSPEVKQVDALGDGTNTYLRLGITPGQTVSNTTEGLEHEGDVFNPDLDIVDWSIEVQQL